MPAKVKPATRLFFIDPNREPIRSVDQVVFSRNSSTQLDLTCLAETMAVGEDGGLANEKVVTARLRINLVMARRLIDSLTQQVAMAEAAQTQVN